MNLHLQQLTKGFVTRVFVQLFLLLPQVRSVVHLILLAIALGADACYVASAPLIAMGCHMCQTCNTGKCNWGIATQRPDLTRRLNPEIAHKRVINLINAWNHEIKEIMGGMGINSIDSLRGNRLMLRGIGLSDKELEILGIKHAGE